MERIYPAVMREIDTTHGSNVDGAIIGCFARDAGKPSVQPSFSIFLVNYKNWTLLGREPIQERSTGGD
jgi:hypothetical protein